MEFAALAQGASAEKLFPFNSVTALKKLDELKKDISVWWTTGAQQSELMLTQEVDLIGGFGLAPAGRDRRSGARFAIQWNQGVYEMEGWSIPKVRRTAISR